jgi:polyphosphate glucokinase
MSTRRNSRRVARKKGPYTLGVDVGGSHIKASVLDRTGTEITPRVEVATPHPAPPGQVLQLIEGLVAELPPFDRISIGFPGAIKDGRVLTAPNLGTSDWHGFPLATELGRRWSRPARMLNDAEVQGFGAIEGKGLECVLTLGTGFGSAVYRDGALMPHLELGQHPVWKSKTYDQYVGEAALESKGVAKWNRRVRRAIGFVRILLNYDRLYLGGGNAQRIAFELPADVTIVSNEAGITGGIRLWDPAMDRFFAASDAHGEA